jgi:Divergent InlB B-repeat domain
MLNVHDGSGDGEYPAGTIVTITADPPPTGQQFVGWTGRHKHPGQPVCGDHKRDNTYGGREPHRHLHGNKRRHSNCRGRYCRE